MPDENEVLKKIANLILDLTGIFIHKNKFNILKLKLDRIVKNWEISNYQEIYNLLIEDKYGPKFFDIINEISVNVTEFNRQSEHFDFLRQIIKEKYIDSKSLEVEADIWSAASSTGQEAYDILMTFLSSIQEFELKNNIQINKKNIRVVGSDISKWALSVAGKGVYQLKEVEGVHPDGFLKSFFQCGTGDNRGLVKIKDFLCDMVQFKYLNLNEPLPFKNEMDIVFLRNVMIYFVPDKQTEILNKICDTIKKGGYLFLGYSEIIADFDFPLKYIKPSIYQKM